VKHATLLAVAALTLCTFQTARAEDDVFVTAAATVRREHPELQQAQDTAPRARDCRETFSVRNGHAKLTAEYRAAHKRAKAQYKALAFYAENCRPLEYAERVVRHEDSEWAFVCRKDRAKPAGLTPQLLEDLHAFGIEPPDMNPTSGRAEPWEAFEDRYFLPLSPRAGNVCATFDAAVEAESTAIADEAVRIADHMPQR
jgi:hypothetical protein